MKKTVSINIKGLNFMIEEDAYELLYAYMNRLEKNLQGQKGSKDIIEDIELRIAELCQEKLSDKKQVIEKEDIDSILATLGRPEDYIEDDGENTEQKFANFEQASDKQKHFYRDIDHAKIAGICAGLSNYFHIDVMLIRILFLIFLFIGGFGIPLYIILWIVIPKTSSTIDRLKMQGKPITVDNVKEEIEQAAQRINSSSRSFADRLRSDSDYSKRFSRIGRILSSVIGFALIGTGLFFLVVFLILFFGGLRFIPIISESGAYLSANQIGELLLSDPNDVFYAWFGIFLTAFSVIIFLISNGTFIFMRIKSKWVKISSLSLIGFGIIGSAICINLGIKTGRDVAIEAEIEKEVATSSLSELQIEVLTKKTVDLEGFVEKNTRNNRFENPIMVNGNTLIASGIELIYKESKDSLFHVYQNLSANSYSYERALKKAKNIRHEIKMDSTKLLISPEFSFSKSEKIRTQKVSIIIEIPKNKIARFGNEIIRLEKMEEEEENEKWGYLNKGGNYETWD